MKVSTSHVFDILSRLRVTFQGNVSIRNSKVEEPFRSELFSSNQMDKHGKVVARSHKLLSRKGSDKMLKRLDDNEKTLLEVRNLLVESIRSGTTITPAAEWLLDNYYLIEEQITIARKHLPKGYSEGLPYLSEGNSAGMPRVYDIVLAIISHSDGRVDIRSLSSFIASYQIVTTLTLGELWAIPIMLRVAVIENLRRVSVGIALDMIDHNLAEYWAERMITTVQEAPGNLVLTIADMVRSKPELTGPFVAGFIRNLQGKGPSLALPLGWMEQQLTALGTSGTDLVQQENQKQAIDQVSVRNSIGTLRFLGTTDWREFVETLSVVEGILRQDPTGIYPLMDFATRDQYRHVVELVSKSSSYSEAEVAGKALELASSYREPIHNSKRKEHVGYFLIDKGRSEVEKAVEMRNSVNQLLVRMSQRMPVFLYLFSIFSLTLLNAGLLFIIAYQYGSHDWKVLILVGFLSVSGSAQLAISLINWLSTILVRPQMLPRMDFSKGIPSEYRTLVVIPTLLSSKAYIEDLVEGLEIRFLANREENLHFGLLTDFKDANAEIMPDDDELLDLANHLIEELNRKYKQPEADLFFLFHRSRTWNEREKKWMGFERKRGKLAALNAFIRGRSKGEFSLVTGNYPILSNVKYVITLDSDTQLPREAARKFIQTMAHPLNQAVYSYQKNRVTDGYGIIQPRVATSIPKSATTYYQRLQGNVSGIDPYTRMSSDVYQDLFGEGSFIGKGIYDVNVFEQAVGQAFQNNRILSHDLIEGCYARSGLLSDVLLYEDSPAQYVDDIKRHHRWIRGDWQIGAWMLPFVTGADGRLKRNKLSALSKWKIADNLRRSLLPLSLLLLFVMGWTVLPFPWFWTLAVTIIILLPVVAAACWQLFHKPKDLSLTAHFAEIGAMIWDVIVQFVFGISVLPYEAWRYTDAVILTNWRMAITRRKLLEWTPFSDSSNTPSKSIPGMYQSLWMAPVLAIGIGGFLCFRADLISLLVASPILILWIAAPVFARHLGKPEKYEITHLHADQMEFLHKTARKTWSFFEHFGRAEENWLPPDNFQEQPSPVIAHRTSPTNMGLALLANLTAYDFGYISIGELTQRTSDTLSTMNRLERFQGHFFNWYDTISLQILQPKYVSTVDSGNLCGHLLTLRQGLLSLSQQPVFTKKMYEGLQTTARLVKDSANGHHVVIVDKILTLLEFAQNEECRSLLQIKEHLSELIFQSGELSKHQIGREQLEHFWTSRLLRQAQRLLEDLNYLVPWLDILPFPEDFGHFAVADHIPTLQTLQDLPDLLLPHIDRYEQQKNMADETDWLCKMRSMLADGRNRATERILALEQMGVLCEDFSTVEYDFLYEKSTNLLRIGYNVEDQRKDNSFYDLLASEARLGVFVGVAQGKLPQESWFALSRLLTNSAGEPILLSWSGSMFEYLMPNLVMPSFENTLLHQTVKATVKRQIEYGDQRGIPWGISESGYNTVDASMNYQYRAFGVPGLGLKRGLEEDLVVAPYATMLALMVSPAKATSNLQLLAAEGYEGDFGFYEAIDFTTSRLPRGKSNSIIYSYMAHHQGMGLLSLSHFLLGKPMQERFSAELRFQATLLLLQERIPRATVFFAHTADIIETHATVTQALVRRITSANSPIPEIQLLSNGRYQVMITNSGAGFTRWKDLALTRWREDTTKDDRGTFCYIKDIDTGKLWSNTYQPTLQTAVAFEAIFSQGHVEFRREDFGIHTKTEIVISPEDDTEMRRIKITNKSGVLKTLEITSYSEVVMASQASDEAHPAFSNLFVQTEIIQEHKTIFSTRRPRSAQEVPPWMFHMMDVYGADIESVSYETDRMEFIGRGNNLTHPQAMDVELLSGKVGSVLDPIMSIRHRIKLKPNQTATIDLIYGIAETRDVCRMLMHKYRDQHLKKRAFELSWTHSQVLLRQINATEADTQLYDRMAASVIYLNSALRADPAVIQNNFRGQSGLWSHSVSGDLPIVLLHIFEQESIELVRQMIQAHAYWRLKGLTVDLVIWNEDHGTYRQVLQDQILGLITLEAGTNQGHSKSGQIFVKSAEQLSSEDRILFESVARVIIYDNRGTLAEQVNKLSQERVLPPILERTPQEVYNNQHYPQLEFPNDLEFFNGTGGFSQTGKSYKIWSAKNKTTPAPWVNVIANPTFGTVVSETGSAYTWAINAHEYRLTPWSNDPVSDAGGEAFYIRDEETGQFWSPCPYPSKGETPYLTTHAFGFTSFEHHEQGISSEMCVFVDTELPVKFILLKIKNQSGRARKLSATGFLEIIMGDVRSKTNMHIISEQEPGTGALLFRNRYNSTFTERVTFFKINADKPGFTTDRSEFIGRNRNLTDPAALSRKRLSGKVGAGIDPCAALQTKFELLDGAEKEIIFQIGNEENALEAFRLIQDFLDQDRVLLSLRQVKKYWQEVMGAVHIQTPDVGLNFLANGWLTYQTLACRIYARSGFYQSGGAFGFRDQLQDVLGLIHTTPELTRSHILLSASRQFEEGDVQHWWHPPEGRGVRTRCSDDLLWLPYATSRYLETTGDSGILNKPIGFLEGRLLHLDEDSLYDLPVSGLQSGSLYNHCVRAINHSLRFGEHGLPLIGSGDWNDGMDQVGNKGKGESVWLGFFLFDVLNRFAETAIRFGDIPFSNTCKMEAAKLQTNLESAAWDGEWYKRAWFDDGTPIGSHVNEECRIDAIAQSWSVISGAGSPKRQEMAMASLDKYLVKNDLKLIQLLDPPFNDILGPNPGYIKGYVPGVRENGGQYSHAAIWALMAFAAMGNRKKVWELFNLVQPINHGTDAESVQVYKVEPYVMAADVYANESHKGRGGWTWYTGSAGWMYQLIIGSLVGMDRNVDKLVFKPCFPLDWPSVTVTYQFRTATYRITVYQDQGLTSSFWKTAVENYDGNAVLLLDDGAIHEVEVHIAVPA